MPDVDTPPAESPDAQPNAEPTLEHGTYEVIRHRLSAAGRKLRERLDRLNVARKDVFGSIETSLLATERVTTDNNCVPRDIAPVGSCFLFGYNVHLGLRTEQKLEDVFAVYRFENRAFVRERLTMIDDERFRRDFAELFKYYRSTVFCRFARIGPHLHMVFRIGQSERDVKTFKWAITEEGLVYLDNRSDHEYRFPPQHEFEWIRTTRDMHSTGPHPHVNIEDRLFVETVGGDLTVKVEDNTDDGGGIYAEPVDDLDQTLDDGEIHYAIVGHLILLKIKPYQETLYRYLAYCEKTQTVLRLDDLAHACVLLPEDHGIVVSRGYLLQTGESKIFDGTPSQDMLFAERLQSPGGEDHLYIFYNRATGTYVLLPYNLIEQRVDAPVLCQGYSIFPTGEMIYFRAQDEPAKHHAIQIWQTPYVGADHEPETHADAYLYKVGNRDVVRAMSECNEILGLIGREDTYAGLFVDLTKLTGDVLDTYYWLDHTDACGLREVLEEIKEAADAAIGEFEKVVEVRRNTETQLDVVAERASCVGTEVLARRFERIEEFVRSLIDLRTLRGEIVALRDLRYIDNARVDGLEEDVAGETDRISKRCVAFLLRPEALDPYQKSLAEHHALIDGLETVRQARELEKQVTGSAEELEMLIEVTSNLKIDDATQRTTIIDRISALFSQVNQTRSALKGRMQKLGRTEGAAEFSAELKLLNQSVAGYLDVCDTPEKCEEYLTKVMVQVEELEGRFAEFDEFVVQLAEKRDEVYDAFESRRVQLVEAKNRRATALAAAADRILKGIQTRVGSLKSTAEIHGYYASDLMVQKVRDLIDQLNELGDSVKVGDIQTRLKTVREDAVRQLRDRQDLYEDGDNVIRLGTHRFAVNTQPFDLTTVHRDDLMCFHLTGTNYFDPITDPAFLDTRPVWQQEIVSENDDVYRAEWLAYRLMGSIGANASFESGEIPELAELTAADDEKLLAIVQRFMGPRYTEGYLKGVHDHDATTLVRALCQIESKAGLLRFHPRARAAATIFWHLRADDEEKRLLAAKLRGFGEVRSCFADEETQQAYIAELEAEIRGVQVDADASLFPEELVEPTAAYLFEELASSTGAAAMVISSGARDLRRAFLAHLDHRFVTEKYQASIESVRDDPRATFLLLRDWVGAFARSAQASETSSWGDYVDEVAALLLTDSFDIARVIEVPLSRELTGMVGTHARIDDGTYQLDYNDFMLRLRRFERQVVPRFEAYVHLKKELIDTERDQMRLDEFRPRVLTSFVRNKLIDKVYLPLIGDNLAKQMGVVGEGKRTDRMGLLLVISPPGYGKTTLMEYVANRLGIVFMKINGPALGHAVTALDPSRANAAAAREELEKLNLAFEMGDNVMIYLDDIQHCNPELLQKFISLCDAQRKIEGVFRGRSRTYDLRGKKVAIVMAGNPYTESGERFKIPDMLSNRADTYNLGDIIGESADLFELSYLENSVTSNPVLNKLAGRSANDVHAVIQIAQTGKREGVDLEGNYSMAELNEMVSVMRKLMQVRDVVLSVNREYIRSASTADDYRTEPAFKLQGSYRNMNRIAERIVAIMNPTELDELILGTYQNDSQTLTTGAESNLLKFKELCNRFTPEEAGRWETIRRTFRRNVQLRGIGDDEKVGQVLVQLTTLSEGLESIREAVADGVTHLVAADAEESEPQAMRASFDESTLAAMRSGIDDLKAAYLQSAKAQADVASDKPQEIHVVSKVPTSILNVLRHQFRLMQGWLEPLGRYTQEHGKEVQNLRTLIEQGMSGYSKLIERLDRSIRQGDHLVETLARDHINAEDDDE